MMLKAQMQTVGTRRPTLVRLWPVRLLITVGGVGCVGGIGGDFSQTDVLRDRVDAWTVHKVTINHTGQHRCD